MKELKENTPFQITMFEELSQAKQGLNERSINMMIHLPEKMTEQLQESEDARINYYINQSVPTITKQMMETTASKLNEQVNQQVRGMINTQMVETIPNIIAADFPSDEMEVMVVEIASQVVELVQDNTKIAPVQANVIKTNDKEGFAITKIGRASCRERVSDEVS